MASITTETIFVLKLSEEEARELNAYLKIALSGDIEAKNSLYIETATNIREILQLYINDL